jgi:hypothetical protein
MSSGLDMMGPERIPHSFAHAYSFFNSEAARMGKFGLANKLGVYGALTIMGSLACQTSRFRCG